LTSKIEMFLGNGKAFMEEAELDDSASACSQCSFFRGSPGTCRSTKDHERVSLLSCGLLDLRTMFTQSKDALVPLSLPWMLFLIENLNVCVKQA
jgi:hypothetical protein